MDGNSWKWQGGTKNWRSGYKMRTRRCKLNLSCLRNEDEWTETRGSGKAAQKIGGLDIKRGQDVEN